MRIYTSICRFNNEELRGIKDLIKNHTCANVDGMLAIGVKTDCGYFYEFECDGISVFNPNSSVATMDFAVMCGDSIGNVLDKKIEEFMGDSWENRVIVARAVIGTMHAYQDYDWYVFNKGMKRSRRIFNSKKYRDKMVDVYASNSLDYTTGFDEFFELED